MANLKNTALGWQKANIIQATPKVKQASGYSTLDKVDNFGHSQQITNWFNYVLRARLTL